MTLFLIKIEIRYASLTYNRNNVASKYTNNDIYVGKMARICYTWT